MKSIIQNTKNCFICGKNSPLERHHCFGASNRKLSEQDGLWVWLCPDCHRNGANAVHSNIELNLFIKRQAQQAWENTYGNRDQFVKRYGKNYLERETDNE